MQKWNTDDLLGIDAKYAEHGTPFHKRPLDAAAEILNLPSIFEVLDHPETWKIIEAYDNLFPKGSESWPGAGIGIAASVDSVRRVVLGVNYDSNRPLYEWELLQFSSKEEWWVWCRKDRDIAAQSSFAVADLHDFSYGMNALQGGSAGAVTLLRLAESHLGDVAAILPTVFSVDTVTQNIHMVVELALKGALVWNGVDPKSFGKPGGSGHNVKLLAQEVAEAFPHRDDALVESVVTALPPYVGTRYKPHGLTPLAVVRLALGAQFVAASVLRRISNVDLAAQMEVGGWPAPRKPFHQDKS